MPAYEYAYLNSIEEDDESMPPTAFVAFYPDLHMILTDMNTSHDTMSKHTFTFVSNVPQELKP
jgi:hypothetical protein